MSSLTSAAAFATTFVNKKNERQYEDRMQKHKLALQENELKLWKQQQTEIDRLAEVREGRADTRLKATEDRAIVQEGDIWQRDQDEINGRNEAWLRGILPDATEEDIQYLLGWPAERLQERFEGDNPWGWKNGAFVTPRQMTLGTSTEEAMRYLPLGMAPEVFKATAGFNALMGYLTNDQDIDTYWGTWDWNIDVANGTVTPVRWEGADGGDDDVRNAGDMTDGERAAFEEALWNSENAASGIANIRLWRTGQLADGMDYKNQFNAAQRLKGEAIDAYLRGEFNNVQQAMGYYHLVYGNSIMANNPADIDFANVILRDMRDNPEAVSVKEKLELIQHLRDMRTYKTEDSLNAQIDDIRSTMAPEDLIIPKVEPEPKPKPKVNPSVVATGIEGRSLTEETAELKATAEYRGLHADLESLNEKLQDSGDRIRKRMAYIEERKAEGIDTTEMQADVEWLQRKFEGYQQDYADTIDKINALGKEEE